MCFRGGQLLITTGALWGRHQHAAEQHPSRCAASLAQVRGLRLALWMGTSLQRHAGQLETQHKRAVAFYRLGVRHTSPTNHLFFVDWNILPDHNFGVRHKPACRSCMRVCRVSCVRQQVVRPQRVVLLLPSQRVPFHSGRRTGMNGITARHMPSKENSASPDASGRAIC